MKKTITRNVRNDLDQKFLVRASSKDSLKVKFSIRHNKPNTSSNIAICVLADGSAKVDVDATIIIENSAPNTKAWLEIRVITRDSAIVTAAPNLEIRNNAVKAGHALTTKHVSEEELFYLMSRGLPREDAEKLVVDAFLQPFQEGEIIES